MKEREIEIVRYPQMSGLSIFLDTVSYRTPHVHEEFELLWILDGRMDIGGFRPQIRVRRGDILLFDPGRIHDHGLLKGGAGEKILHHLPGSLRTVAVIDDQNFF